MAKDNGNSPIRNCGAKGFAAAVASLAELQPGEQLEAGRVLRFKASAPMP